MPIGVRVTGRRTAIEPDRVAAFLPLRFSIDNDTGRRATVRVQGVGRITVKPGEERASLRTPGLEPGRYRVTGPAGATTLRVRPGG